MLFDVGGVAALSPLRSQGRFYGRIGDNHSHWRRNQPVRRSVEEAAMMHSDVGKRRKQLPAGAAFFGLKRDAETEAPPECGPQLGSDAGGARGWQPVEIP